VGEQYNAMSDDELQQVIKNAERAIEERRRSRRKDVEVQIRRLADSIGMDVQLTEREMKPRGSSMKGAKIAPKYRHPGNPQLQWTGRGVVPKWLKELEAHGRSKDEFLIR
jgi:DNA-binding protein H-NS